MNNDNQNSHFDMLPLALRGVKPIYSSQIVYSGC